MPVDKYGRVIVNPSMPLGMEDFAAMYTAGGRSPQENASQLWFNAPREGQSYMSDQWSNLNTGTSPEQYFSDPAHVAAVAASNSPSGPGGARHAPTPNVIDPLGRIPVSPGNTGQEQWPMYQSEMHRNMAYDLGMDQRAKFTTPDKMLAHTVGALKSVPKQDLLDHPELTNLVVQDPEKAEFVYSKLSGGRSFKKDRGEMDTLRRQLGSTRQLEAEKDMRAPMEFAKDITKDLIKRDASYDPQTGKLTAWEFVQPEPGALDQRPVRKRVTVGKELEYQFRRGYPLVMGSPLPPTAPPDPALQAAKLSFGQTHPHLVSKFEEQMQQWKDRGLPMTAQNVQIIADRTREDNKDVFSGPHGESHYMDMANSITSSILGKQGWEPGRDFSSTPNNAWGRMIDKGSDWMSRLMHGSNQIQPAVSYESLKAEGYSDEMAAKIMAGVSTPQTAGPMNPRARAWQE